MLVVELGTLGDIGGWTLGMLGDTGGSRAGGNRSEMMEDGWSAEAWM